MKILKNKQIENWQSDQIENALRRHTAKRKQSLNWMSSSYFNLDKYYFLGVENETSMNITRITTSYELFLPKIIIDFSKSDFTSYSIHLSILYKVIFIILCIASISAIYNAIVYFETEGLLFGPISIVIFYYLTKWEMNLTHKKILSTIQQYHSKGKND